MKARITIAKATKEMYGRLKPPSLGSPNSTRSMPQEKKSISRMDMSWSEIWRVRPR